MDNKSYVSVGNIIEEERLRRQERISNGIAPTLTDQIEKSHQDEIVSNVSFFDKAISVDENVNKFAQDIDVLSKSETEFLLSKLQRQINVDSESTLLKAFKSVALNHLNDIEKGTYSDNSFNRKLGRVGQEYGGKNNP